MGGYADCYGPEDSTAPKKVRDITPEMIQDLMNMHPELFKNPLLQPLPEPEIDRDELLDEAATIL